MNTLGYNETGLARRENYVSKGSGKSLSGMSKGEDLIGVWNKFKSDKEPDLVVLWDFQDPKYAINDEKSCVYIMNIRSLYNRNLPGHWVALIKVRSNNGKFDKIYYYDPFSCILVKRGTDKLKCRYIYENLIKEQNFTGKDSDSCGYYCILFLLSWIRRTKYYRYAVFDNERKKFVDTIPNNKYIKINFEAMDKEILNNIAAEKI